MDEKTFKDYKVVLTADRTLMSEYNRAIFLGFSACIPVGLMPDKLYFSFVCPTVQTKKDGAVKYAPCGTRKIEAALLDNGFKREEIIVAHPDYLGKVIGPSTKVVGITENDPLGIGPATSTFTQLFGGEAYMTVKFRELLSHLAVKKYKPKIVVGGPGAWQPEDKQRRDELGIDCVVIGEGENVVSTIFQNAVNGEPVPEIVYGDVVSIKEMPLIKEPTIDGIVEIARGCGRGCAFCVPTAQRYRCFPISHILQEIEVNLRAGRRPLLHAEDVLRYKAKGIEVNKEEVTNLFKTVKNHPGVDSVAISHLALSSVVNAPEVVEEISNILDLNAKDWLGGQTGIETGSPQLIKKFMGGKCKPFTPEEWPDIVLNAFDILSRNFWVPVATMIMGFPGETERDIDLSTDLVKRLKPFKSLIVPLFLVSEGRLKEAAESFSVNQMTPKHGEFFVTCWEHNLDWADTFLKEFFLTKSRGKGYALKLFVSYAAKQGRKLIETCREDYDFDLQAMIKDAKEGKISVGPMAFRLVSKLLQSGTH